MGGHRRPADRTGDDLGLPGLTGAGTRRHGRHGAPCSPRHGTRRTRGPFPARGRGRVPRTGCLCGGRRAGGTGRVLGGGPQPARGRESSRRAGQHDRARRHVDRCRTTQPRKGAASSRRSRPPSGTASRTRVPPPTCTSAWPSSIESSMTSRAPKLTWRRRGSLLNAPPSARTGTDDLWSWPRCTPPAATTTRHWAGSSRPSRSTGTVSIRMSAPSRQWWLDCRSPRETWSRQRPGQRSADSASTTSRTSCTSTST